MKKVLIGCAVVSLVVLVGGGLAAYHFVYKPAAELVGSAYEGARNVVSKAGAVAETIERMRALEAEVRVTGPYVAPADGALTPTQIERFLAVHQAVSDRLGPERARIAQVIEEVPAQGEASALLGSLSALAALGDVGLAAKRAQVDALNAQGLSLAEYRWIRQTAIEALIAGGIEMSVDAGEVRAARLIEEFQRAAAEAGTAARAIGQILPGAQTAPSEVPPAPTRPSDAQPVPAGDGAIPTPALAAAQRANFELVREHRDTFARSQLLALVGL